jgi:hypothetical protein
VKGEEDAEPWCGLKTVQFLEQELTQMLKWGARGSFFRAAEGSLVSAARDNTAKIKSLSRCLDAAEHLPSISIVMGISETLQRAIPL